jgi:hypothetical protein
MFVACRVRTMLLVVATALVPGCGSRAEPDAVTSVTTVESPTIITGHVRGWPEATQHLRVELNEHVTAEIGDPRPAGLDVFWSIASTHPGAGFFYSDTIRGTGETRVAHAVSARRVSDIRDASLLEFTRTSVGPIPVGGIVVVAHAPSGRYLAIAVDGITPTDPRTAGAGPYAHADVTWYLTPPGVTDFSAAP